MIENKEALVPGGGYGIGRGISIELAGDGADRIINFFRNRWHAEETSEEFCKIGRQALVVEANVGEVVVLIGLYQVVEESLGGTDIMIHHATSGYNRPVMRQNPKAGTGP